MILLELLLQIVAFHSLTLQIFLKMPDFRKSRDYYTLARGVQFVVTTDPVSQVPTGRSTLTTSHLNTLLYFTCTLWPFTYVTFIGEKKMYSTYHGKY